MSFGAPIWLLALLLLPLFVLLFAANERRRRALVQKIVAARLLPQLAGGISSFRRRLRFGLLLGGFAAAIVSLAQPRIGYNWEQSKRKGIDILIAIDTSKSMMTPDVSPNRLTHAKLAALDLLSSVEGDRVGVLAFAGEAFLQAPLTIDYGAVEDAINDLDTNTIERGGTDISSVIREAAKAFGKGESEDRCLILFTDGEDLDEDAVAAARAEAGNFRIFTVGVGTAEGALIPVPGDDGGTAFVKDPDGQFVKSKLDEERLKQIAAAADGFYTHLQNGQADMKKIVEEGIGKLHQHDIDTHMSRHPIERYQWPLALAMILIAASMLVSEKKRATTPAKRGAALQTALLLVAVWLSTHSAQAAALNEGVDLYNEKKYKESYDTFSGQLLKNPDSQALEFDSGAAAFKAGDYEKAIEAFGRAIASPKPGVRGKAEYNLANTLAMRGLNQQKDENKITDWNNAIQHYDEALKIDPKNQDASYNRNVVQQMIEELKKQQQQQQQQDQNQKNDQNKKNDQKQNQQQNQQNQQNKDNQQKQKDQQQQSQGNNQQNNQQQQQSQGNNQQNNQQQQQSQGNNQQNNQQQQQSQGNNQQNNQQQQQSQGNNQQNNQQQQQPQGNSQQNNQQGDQQQQSQNNGQQSQQNQSQPQSQPGSEKSSSNQQQQAQAQPSAAPSPGDHQNGQPGQIQAQAQQGDNSQNAQNGQPAGTYVPGQERAMTPEEARRVVESEKNEEAKGVLIEHKSSAPVLKDW